MRSCNKNKQRLLYSDLIKVSDGKETFENTDESIESYTTPQEFYGNIHSSGGQAEARYYGLSAADYDAVLYVPKGEKVLKETSLIWYNSKPSFLDAEKTEIDPKSADYKVIRVPPCLDERVYLLERVNKRGEE